MAVVHLRRIVIYLGCFAATFIFLYKANILSPSGTRSAFNEKGNNIMFYKFLPQDAGSWSDITPCNNIDKTLLLHEKLLTTMF